MTQNVYAVKHTTPRSTTLLSVGNYRNKKREVTRRSAKGSTEPWIKRWWGFLNCLSLSLTLKDDIQLLVPLWHVQVAQGSLPNISSPAIKPHFAAFHTNVSDECRVEPSLCSASALWKATLSSFGKSQTVSSFWCPPSLHSLAVWWRKDHLNMSLRAGLEMLAIYFRVFNLILSW